MIKNIITGLFVLLAFSAGAQLQTQIVGDSVRLHANAGTAELILENSTKDVNGFLYNKGNGRTEFRKAFVKLNDSLFISGGDTINISPGMKYTVQSLTDASTISWDIANGANGAVTLGATGRTLSISNPVAGQSYHLKIIQDGTGGRTITTWPTGTVWPLGTPPSLSLTSGAVDLVTFYYDGASYYGDFKSMYASSANVSILYHDEKYNFGSTTHSFSNVPPGALLVLTTTGPNAVTNCSVSSSPSLTWTKQADASATGSGDAEIYTAVYAGGGSISVTSNWGSEYQASVCYTVINQELTLGGATATGTGQSTPSVSLTTTRANSIIFCATSDWNNIDGSTTRAYRNSPTERLYHADAGAATYYHYYKDAPTTSSYTMGLSAPSGQKGGTVLLEVRSK